MHLSRIQYFKQMLSRYQRNRDLISVGAYAKGSDPLLDQAIEMYPQLEAFLQQSMNQRADFEHASQQLAELLPQRPNH
jgi:flagellum-specific ATP synthase